MFRLTTWLILLTFFGGVFYGAYRAFLPPPKKRTKRVDPTPNDPVTVTASGATYQESWIPEHHLKKAGSRRGLASSGNEPSSDEASGAEKRKASRKKSTRT